MPETKHRNTYLDKKINDAIKRLLNEMSVHDDNSPDEDVTLPEILDRITRRINSNIEVTQQAVSAIQVLQNSVEKDYAAGIEFYPSIFKFPGADSVKADTIYVDKNDLSLYMWDDPSSSYVPVNFSVSTSDLSLDAIQEVVKIIDGGTALTNI